MPARALSVITFKVAGGDHLKLCEFLGNKWGVSGCWDFIGVYPVPSYDDHPIPDGPFLTKCYLV